MREYENQHMICDTIHADGHVFFMKEYLEFRARDARLASYNFVIYYKDIEKMEHYSGIKKTVHVILKDGRVYKFALYRSATFMELVKSGMAANSEVKEYDYTKEEEPEAPKKEMSNEDIDKLTKLSQLHKDGVLNDEEFETQKEAILNKYR